MRIVKSLKDIKLCPNCGSIQLLDNHTVQGRDYILCIECGEEIYENEYTINAEEAQEPVFNVGKAPDDIDDSLMEIEYELGTYEMMASTSHELLMANCMRGIIEKLVSVIRRIK